MEIKIRSNGRKYSMKDNKNRFFFPEEYIKFFECLKKKSKHTVQCQLNTGARIRELQNVKVEDINFDDNWIILRVTKTKAKKGERKGEPRYIPISSQFSKYLKKYTKKNKLSSLDTIGILSTPALNIAIKKAATLAGLKNPHDFSSHTLRKTLECYLMALGINDMKICKHIGHDIKTALSSYVSPDIFNAQQKWMMRDLIGDLYNQ